MARKKKESKTAQPTEPTEVEITPESDPETWAALHDPRVDEAIQEGNRRRRREAWDNAPPWRRRIR